MSADGDGAQTLEELAARIEPLRADLRQCVFLCGCGHSGTSIMARILAAHPAAHVPQRETEVFVRDKLTAITPDTVRKVLALFREAAASGRHVLIEKTPKHLYSIELIRRLVPGARFVLPVRDGRDVTASIAHRTADAAAGLDRWVRETGLVADERGRPDVHVYRYEDFVSDPTAIVSQVCEFAGLSFFPELLDYHASEQLWFREKSVRKGDGRSPAEHRSLRNWQINQPIFDGRGRWRDELQPEQLRSFESGPARHLMEAFGYF